MWKIYDELIAAIPPGLAVTDCLLRQRDGQMVKISKEEVQGG